MSLLPDEGNQEQPTGGAESPASQTSGGQGQPLPDVSALARRLDEQDKLIRGLQKGTDKQIAQVNSNVKRILELKEQGLNEEQIKRELWIDQQMQGQTPHPQAPVGNESARQAPDVESAFKKLEEYNLDQNDQEFISLVRQSSRLDKAAFDEQVNGYVLGKLKPQKPANPSDVVQSPVTGGQQPKSQTALTQEYLNEMSGARGKGFQVGDAIKQKFREKGLNVDEIHIRV